MNYISINNKKAICHFKRLGCNLIRFKRLDPISRMRFDLYLYLDVEDLRYVEYYLVEGKPFDGMSGTKFHKYLIDHGLLMNQQD